MKIDLEKIKKIITETTDEVARNNLVILLQSYQQTRQAYTAEPTAAFLRNWRAAEVALIRVVAELDGAAGGAGGDLRGIPAMLQYLRDQGWKISRSQLYRDFNDRKIVKKGGAFQPADVDRYANIHLKLAASGKYKRQELEETQLEKADLEKQKLMLDIKRARWAHDREQGLYIPRNQVDLEFAALAGILEAELRSWVRSDVSAWIRAVNGDEKRAGELIVMMSQALDTYLDNLSRPRDYEITLESEKIQADADDDQIDAEGETC